LLSNSIDAYASAKHGISTVIIRRNTDENDVLLTIQDFGPGIPQEIQKKIFEPLFTTKPPELGTGVGLAMSKTIVEKDFGGTLSFVSEENHGTSFMVRVPRFVEMEK